MTFSASWLSWGVTEMGQKSETVRVGELRDWHNQGIWPMTWDFTRSE